MARNGVNKVILLGNLGQDPEVRYLPNGAPVSNFTLATSEAWRDKATDTMKEQTEWHRLVCFRKLAEVVGNYLRKGSRVYIEGRLKTRKWKDNAGQDRTTTEVHVDELRILDTRSSSSSGDAAEPSGYAQGSGSRGPAAREEGNVSVEGLFDSAELEEGIPF